MKIKRITLYNIGPYTNENTFNFTIDKIRNIVLIGGKNGAGKTTFFKAIKTCLYGCKVWGFDAPGKEYYSIINGLVNFKTAYDNSTKAFIELELVFDDGKHIDTYVLHREWKKVKMTLSEFFHIRKNGELILGTEEEDFINYLLSVIPPDMFNFYFFDGESIAEFFLGAEGNKNFRNAFLKLYGLDTLSILIENFARNIKKTDAKKNSFEIFNQSRLIAEKEEQVYNELQQEITEIENKIDLCDIKLRSLMSDYTKEGGVSLTEWKETNAQLLKEENVRDNLNRWLKEIANHYLPFILLEKNLHKLLSELSISQENQKTKVVLDLMSSDSFILSVQKLLDSKKVINISVDELVSVIKGNFTTEETISFDYTSNQINRLISQIYEKFDFDTKQIKQALSQLSKSLKNSKRLREIVVASSVDGYENFVAQKEELDKSITELKILLEKKRQTIETQKQVMLNAQDNFEKAKKVYESILKNRSINDLSERAVATYSILEDKLVRRQAKILQESFIECFSSIINKDNFIDGIVIDKNINVIPYKYIKVTRSQLENYKQVNKSFLELFNNVQMIVDMNKLEFCEVDEIKLPSPISAPFSQGERQVYIMSIYLALLKTSHKDIPFFIDTPFARIDSNHRANIVTQFFNALKNQLFVLSTDEEIVGEYKEKMNDRISDVFTLQISDYGTTKIVAGEYFGGQK